MNEVTTRKMTDEECKKYFSEKKELRSSYDGRKLTLKNYINLELGKRR